MIGGPDRPAAAPTTTNPILWGAYLACSWTWCIGMFLPALLLRDHGWLGFAIFAVPNCVGAAAMGWVMRTPESSRRFVERHANAVRWFAIVTIGYHIYWIAWVMPNLRDALPMPDPYLFGGGAVGVAFAIVSGRAIRMGAAPRLAMALLVLSVGVLGAMVLTGDGAGATETLVARSAPGPSTWSLAPLACFGFLLCPYLDPTFHHAREHLPTPRAARLAFGIGFLVFFALMILLTTRYAGVLALGIEGDTALVPVLSPLIAAGVLAHILCQWIFTVRVHLDRVRAVSDADPVLIQSLFGVALISGLLGLMVPRLAPHAGLGAGEIGYRAFLWFYGLVFPCIVLYGAVRRRADRVPLQRGIMLGAIAVATPMFWLGFIERSSFWLVPGVLVAVVGAFVLRAQPGEDTLRRGAHEG